MSERAWKERRRLSRSLEILSPLNVLWERSVRDFHKNNNSVIITRPNFVNLYKLHHSNAALNTEANKIWVEKFCRDWFENEES